MFHMVEWWMDSRVFWRKFCTTWGLVRWWVLISLFWISETVGARRNVIEQCENFRSLPRRSKVLSVVLIDVTRKENLSIFHVIVREVGVQRVESRTSSYFLWCIFRLHRDLFQDLHRAWERTGESEFYAVFQECFFVCGDIRCIAETAKKQDSAPYTYVRFVFMFILCCSFSCRRRRRLISLLLLCITLWFGISVASCASQGDFLRFRGVCYFSTEIINIIAGGEK